MREPAPHYSSNQYERPNQSWVCGLAGEGHACPAAPNARGTCPALGECAPVRDGDRWRCNRSGLRGGVCEVGPTPEGGCGRVPVCHPARSLRAMRGRFVTALSVFTVGALAIMLSGNWRDAAISPGPLAGHHAQLIEGGRGAANCAACHSVAERGVGGWAAATIMGHGDRATQSELCMECHDKTIAREVSLVAHNIRPEKGSELFSTPSDLNERVRGENSSDPFSLCGDIACATCHREHNGAEFNLTAIGNDACQACHRQRYRSFADDHPDFGVWPYERQTRIVFDHASHQAKHFAERKRTFDCRACHVDDGAQDVQLTASYEQACATCHDEKIVTSIGRGIAMLVLPTVDVDALQAAGLNIGPWPEAATGDFDGRLPPMMKLLLAADPAAAKAMATLGEDFEFIDVDPEDEDQLAASAELAAAIKTLLVDLSQRGPVVVRERLSMALGREVSHEQLDALVAGMSADTVRGAAAAWLPGVDDTANDWLGGSMLSPRNGVSMSESADSMPTPRRGEGMPPDAAPSFAPAGSWTRDDATLAIRYSPAAHADPVLTSWLAVLAETPELPQRPQALAMFKELAKPTAAGLCASCHSVEQSAPGRLAINWRAYTERGRDSFATVGSNGRQSLSVAKNSRLRGRTFTMFSHGPHLLLPQLVDCTECHAIEAAAATAASYADWNPHTFVSEFRAISKRQCAECHTATAAGDRCQSCHNYHVQAVESWRGVAGVEQ